MGARGGQFHHKKKSVVVADKERIEQAVARGLSTSQIMALGYSYLDVQTVKAGMVNGNSYYIRYRAGDISA